MLTIRLVELDLLGIGVAEAVRLAIFLESRKVCPLGEEVFVSPIQVFEGMLQRVNRRRFELRSFIAVPPGRQLLGHVHTQIR